MIRCATFFNVLISVRGLNINFVGYIFSNKNLLLDPFLKTRNQDHVSKGSLVDVSFFFSKVLV